ncbi:MAG TPA: hypothetical protein PLK76_03945 [bacterium]|nr:hypothetical protein [bacterium]
MADKPKKVTEEEFDEFLFGLFEKHLWFYQTIDLVLVQEEIKKNGWAATYQEIIVSLNRFLRDPEKNKYFYAGYRNEDIKMESCPVRLCFVKD